MLRSALAVLAASLSCSMHGDQKISVSEAKLAMADELEKAALFARCEPMSVVVADRSEDEYSEGAEQAISNAAVSRLKVARLYEENPEDSKQTLHISVRRDVDSYSVHVQMVRVVSNTGYGFPGYATVWQRDIMKDDADAKQLLIDTSILIDVFLAKYAQANEDVCFKGSPPTKPTLSTSGDAASAGEPDRQVAR